jgi:hypothetical protein
MCDVEHDAIATTVGCLSLVVPNFARAPLISGTSHLFDGSGTWRALVTDEVARMISIKDLTMAMANFMDRGVAGADEFQAVDVREQIGRGWGPRAD